MAKAPELVVFAKEPCAGEDLLFRVVEQEVLSRVLNLGCVALALMLTR